MYKAVLKHVAAGSEMVVVDATDRWHSKKDGKFTFKPMSAKDATKASKGLRDFSKGASSASQTLQGISRNMKGKKAPRKDLSNLSDKELQQILNRERMEREYDSYFNTPQESKGQKFVENLGTGLSYAAAIAAIVGTGFSIYATVKGSGDKKGG